AKPMRSGWTRESSPRVTAVGGRAPMQIDREPLWPSLSGHCGHGSIFIAQRSVANDPGCVKTLRGITAPGILSPTILRRAKKRKNSPAAWNYDQIRFRFRTAKTQSRQLWPLQRVDRRSSPSFVERNFDFAARAVRWKYQVDGAAEFMGNEIADEA